ncbi:MAG TPA: bifunctional [glutamine synthetase] adenylyltransferase/[glutamine synthetase]-adenylyl-L-tyrosine phosphorylase [Caulobacteraceae bacterium]|jgi:glutamate-ammonia-ligase adenylyltransferase|nr:bifunctional [glutamine synthetase] adenylyltransferase/[glutamine synthetase]-adenylyl-L-tyrosine phosphorylase [Caulobacteraceae bacterium]
MTLADRLRPCGPVIDPAAASRARAALPELSDHAWDALAPVVAASPYLARLTQNADGGLAVLLAADPEISLDAVIAEADAAGALAPDAGRLALRRLKARLHLLTALCDLGGVWDLGQVTGALTRFADASVRAAMALTAQNLASRLAEFDPTGPAGPLPGLFVVALGKMGAFELNYSSDIDICVFYEPDALPLAPGAEPDAFATRFTQGLATTLQDRTGEGYVFRVDLRLRPDPLSTGPAVPVEQALDYYESVGQNWERAAMIKARICAGDLPRGEAFLEELRPFIWRRHLDFAAITDIHSIKRQIQELRPEARLAAPGADLKLGPGGIREIEFFVQTQQLILGGRHPDLRSRRTLDALAALSDAGHVTPAAAEELAADYAHLRGLEHRVQMIADEQTHRLPTAERERHRVAALAGEADLRRFDAGVVRTLRSVGRRYGELFAGEEPLSSRHGSLVFTGVGDDPQTLETLRRMGFSDAHAVAASVRAWHHGRIAATRTERGRELFTRLAPRLLDALAATGAPDAAFTRFSDFFGALSTGVQVQSLFLAQPKLLELIVRVMAIAPRFARTLARRPDTLDALLDPAFFAPLSPIDALPPALAGAEGFEAAMDAARRLCRERGFQVALQILAGTASAAEAGEAFADLADICIASLAEASLAEVARQAGAFPGQFAVIALGKCGSREMTATSDLDLMTLYAADAPDSASALKGWAAETFYGRLTGRLVTALSAPTAEGDLYKVDMQLRPSGTAGPVAVSFGAFDSYYADDAETWEYLALTRARVVWATSEAFRARAEAAIEAKLRAPRDPAETAADVLDMRALMARERPPSGFWDFKLSEGGQVDIEFAAQFLQLINGAAGGPLRQNTASALAALAAEGLAPAGPVAELAAAWRLQQDLSQLTKVALTEENAPEQQPKALRDLMAKAGGVRDLKALRTTVTTRREAAHRAFLALVAPP